jgi:DNA-binding NarL/FixJ family response regulator
VTADRPKERDMAALALTSDLLLRSQLAGAGARVGADVEVVASIEELLAKAETARPALVILDLNHADLKPAELVAALKARVPSASLLVFGPHVHKARLAAAAEAGCDRVISRGQFHAEMDSILAADH